MLSTCLKMLCTCLRDFDRTMYQKYSTIHECGMSANGWYWSKNGLEVLIRECEVIFEICLFVGLLLIVGGREMIVSIFRKRSHATTYIF